MPNRGRGRGRGGGGGGIFGTIFGLAMVAVVLYAGHLVTGINSIPDVINYFSSKSNQVDECNGEGLDWKCKGPKGESGSGDGSGGDSGSNGDSEGAKSYSPKVKGTVGKLQALKVADANESAPYSRKDWKHWIGSPCNTRETVLKMQGTNVKTDPKTCKILSGEWTDKYEGKKVTESRQLDIDHVVPLSYAAKHGGDSWDAQKKQAFANDTDQLLAVTASSNRSKGDKGPGEWMPDKNRCDYSERWVNTASKYGLTISSKDKQVLEDELSKCG